MELRSWIVEQIFETTYSKEQKLQDLLYSDAKIFFKNTDKYYSGVEWVRVECKQDDPFEGYLTIDAEVEDRETMARYSDSHGGSMIMRLSDRKVFDPEILNPEKAIQDTAKIENLVYKYVDKVEDYVKWYWVREMPLRFTKEGLSVGYGHYLQGVDITETCTIPYAEAIPALSEDVKAFMPKSIVAEAEARAKNDNAKPELTDVQAIRLIKMANLAEPYALSDAFRKYWNKQIKPQESSALIFYGHDMETELILDPKIKIFKTIPGSGDSKIVIFDAIKPEGAYYNWMSQDGHMAKINAMRFIFENGRWVVDNYTDHYGNLNSFKWNNPEKHIKDGYGPWWLYSNWSEEESDGDV